MKKFFFLAAFVAATFSIASCSDSDDNDQEQPSLDVDSYVGSVITTNLSASPETSFTLNDIVFTLNETDNPDPQNDVAEVVMDGVKFAEAMPGMQITISNITETAVDDVYSIKEGKATTAMMGSTVEMDVTNVIVTEIDDLLAVEFEITYNSQAEGENDYKISFNGRKK